MTPVSRRQLGALVAFLGVPAIAWADEAAVRQPINELYAGLEKLMRMGGGTPFAERFAILAPIVDKAFDLETILRVSVGLRWAAFDDATKATLRAAFRRFTIASYVANFDKYEGEKFEIAPETRKQGENEIVQSRIVASNGDPIKMDYVMHRDDGVWRVTDILLDGTISRVAVQRSDFRALLAKGEAGPLIQSLQRKTADLSGGVALGS
jgi:phospholipid transport system substrate-binding protein